MSQMETGDFNERIGVSVLNTDAWRAVDSSVAAHDESSSESATPRRGHTWNRQHPGGLIVINIRDELGKKAQLFRICRAFSKKGFRSMRLSAVPAGPGRPLGWCAWSPPDRPTVGHAGAGPAARWAWRPLAVRVPVLVLRETPTCQFVFNAFSVRVPSGVLFPL